MARQFAGADENGDGSLTAAAIHEGGWYTKFGDVCFWLRDASDGGTNLYWQSRDSHMLIRGGSNYAYEQANGELTDFIAKQYALDAEQQAEQQYGHCKGPKGCRCPVWCSASHQPPAMQRARRANTAIAT